MEKILEKASSAAGRKACTASMSLVTPSRGRVCLLVLRYHIWAGEAVRPLFAHTKTCQVML